MAVDHAPACIQNNLSGCWSYRVFLPETIFLPSLTYSELSGQVGPATLEPKYVYVMKYKYKQPQFKSTDICVTGAHSVSACQIIE